MRRAERGDAALPLLAIFAMSGYIVWLIATSLVMNAHQREDFRATQRTAWTHCVTSALVTGTASDANVQTCDYEYGRSTGDHTVLWLWCPGPVERGGCEARTGERPGQSA